MEYFGKTNIGLVRTSNQDNYDCRKLYDNVFLFTICDGMGGTKGGNIASEKAISVFSDYVEKEIRKTENKKGIPSARKINFDDLLNEAVEVANKEVFNMANSDPDLAQMGTTLVAGLFFDDKVYSVNVGDSRLYRFIKKNKKLTRITHDHSYVQALVDLGQLTPEEAAVNPRRNILTMAVGTEPEVEPDITFFKPDTGDYILLCSDGLYNNFNEDELCDVIFDYDIVDSDKGLSETENKIDALIDLSLEKGGRDNITAILIKY